MYRGSSGLLQKNHLIHEEAVKIFLSETCQKLKCSPDREVSQKDIEAILEVKSKLANHYKSISFTKGTDQPRSISPTDALLSKIMLGTLGCIPAYDRYFIIGFKQEKISRSFSHKSFTQLFEFIDIHSNDIKAAQELILSQTKTHYPIMKIVGMYF